MVLRPHYARHFLPLFSATSGEIAVALTGNQITGAVGSVTFQVTNLFDSSTFAASVDAALSTYIGQMGESWTHHPHTSYATGEFTIDAASGRAYPTNTIAYYASGVPASADYYSELDVFVASVISENIGPCVRMDTTANTFYQFRLRDGTSYELRKTVNDGTPVTLGTSTSNLPSAGQTKRLRIVAKGSQIWGEVDSVLTIGPITDTDITAAGSAGIRASGTATSSTGYHVSNFKAGNGGGAFASLTGVGTNAAVGSFAPAFDMPLSNVVGTLSPGSLAPSIDRTLSGVQSVAAVGTLTPGLAVSISGVQLAGSVGTVTLSQAVTLTGVSSSAVAGTLRADRDLLLNGLASSVAVGSLSPALSVTLTGTQSAAAAGLLSPAIDKALTGVSGSAAVNSLGVSVTVSVTGNQANGAVGTLSPDNAVLVALTGVQATGQVGTLTNSRTMGIAGVESIGALGDFGISKGGSAVLSGVGAVGAVGNLSPEISAALSGVNSVAAAGLLTASRVVNLSGVHAIVQVGSLTVSVDVGLTGVGLVGHVGSLGIATDSERTIRSTRGALLVTTGAGQTIVRSDGPTHAKVRHGR